MVQTRQPTIERAITLVEAEIELLEDEADAFERFLGHLHDIGTSGSNTAASGGPPVGMVGAKTVPTEGVREVRRAYRETVMATPHYEEEYGDTLRESVAEELGERLAGHIADGELLTPAIHEALIRASEEARDNRRYFLRHLHQERESLQDIEAELNDIERSVADLVECIRAASTSSQLASIDTELAALERQCVNVANRRQSTIHDRSVRTLSGVDGISLVRYLYAEMETVTPAISDVATLLGTIRCQREQCLR